MKKYQCNRPLGLLRCTAILTLTLLASLTHGLPAKAVSGFNGSFSESNWTLNGVYPYSACDDYGTASFGCAEIVSQNDGIAFVGGPQLPSSLTTTTWSWYNDTGQNYYVTLNYELTSFNLTSQSATIEIGGFSATINSGTPLIGAIENKLVAPTQSISFIVTVGANQEAAGLDISNFNAVPAPLPAAGAATAFGYSRRLRRRIRGGRPAGAGTASAPSHPCVYLNLSPCSLRSIPISFCYARLPEVPERDRPAA